MATKNCNVCHNEKPLNREYFGSASGGRKWQSTCRVCMAIRSKEHRLANKSILSEKDKERRQKRVNFGDVAMKWELWNTQNGICLCCARDIIRSEVEQSPVDHMVPLARGGNNDRKNLAIAHTKCNQEKHNKTLEEHWAWRHRVNIDHVQMTEGRLQDALGEAGRRRYQETKKISEF